MAQSVQVKATGVLQASPATPGLFSCSLLELLNISFCATYGAAFSSSVPVNSPSAPVAVPFQGITKGRAIAMRLLSGASMTVTITTTAKGPATFNMSDLWLLHSPNPGDEVVSITLQGVGDVAYAIAGDVT